MKVATLVEQTEACPGDSGIGEVTTQDWILTIAQATKQALDEAGYTMPFPQRTLWFGPGNTELALQERRADIPA